MDISEDPLISIFLRVGLVVAALSVYFYLIWGGLEWITSGGDKEKTRRARNKITGAILGLVLVSALYTFLLLVLNKYITLPPINLPTASEIADIFTFIINLTIGVGWSLVFVMFALGFTQYVMSRGEMAGTDQAQKWLTFAVIGGMGLFFVMVVRNVLPEFIQGDVTFTLDIQAFLAIVSLVLIAVSAIVGSVVNRRSNEREERIRKILHEHYNKLVDEDDTE